MGWAEYADVCIPRGQFITFTINQFQIGTSNWVTAVCYQNAIARWLYSSPNSSQFANIISQFNWKGESTSCPSQNSTPPQNPNQNPMYIVSVSGLDANGKNFQHDVTAELTGTDPTNWNDYTFMQYENNNIQIAQVDSSGFAQIPKGYGSMSTTVTINTVTNITVDDSDPTKPSIIYTPGPNPVVFLIDSDGTPTYQNPI